MLFDIELETKLTNFDSGTVTVKKSWSPVCRIARKIEPANFEHEPAIHRWKALRRDGKHAEDGAKSL